MPTPSPRSRTTRTRRPREGSSREQISGTESSALAGPPDQYLDLAGAILGAGLDERVGAGLDPTVGAGFIESGGGCGTHWVEAPLMHCFGGKTVGRPKPLAESVAFAASIATTPMAGRNLD